MHVYFNPLDTSCKNIIGGVKKGDLIQLNIFHLKNTEKDANLQAKNGIFALKIQLLITKIKQKRI